MLEEWRGMRLQGSGIDRLQQLSKADKKYGAI